MLARTAGHPTLDLGGAPVIGPAQLGRVAVKKRAGAPENLPDPALADRLRPTADVQGWSWEVDRRSASVFAAPDTSSAALAAFDAGTAGGSCPPRTTTQIVCATNARCVCPLAGSMSDAERATMNDISRQASRLGTALAWIFTLLALVGMLAVMVMS